MHRAGKVHPLLTRHGYAGVEVNCVRDLYLPAIYSIDTRSVACDTGRTAGKKFGSSSDGRAEARD
jgi:hypothetical protein